MFLTTNPINLYRQTAVTSIGKRAHNLSELSSTPIPQKDIDDTFKKLLAEEKAKYEDEDRRFHVSQEDLRKTFNL